MPDHCPVHALSDPKLKELQGHRCPHIHSSTCSSCEEQRRLLNSAVTAVQNISFRSEEEKDDPLYMTQQAVEAIEAWKAHQLRSVQQDKCRTNVLAFLAETSVFVTQDWVRKYLPRKFRESQSDWFAKWGISWHVSVVLRRVDGALQTLSFIHVVENCS